jgi:hypothetical protein
MSHYSPLSGSIDSLLALVVGLALHLHLQQDPLQFSNDQSNHLTLADRTSVEMRRRLWWHIMTLDVQYAEYMKKDPVIYEAMWTTKFPSSFNDGELDALSQVPIPPPSGEIFDQDSFDIGEETTQYREQRDRRTDMSFALSRIELMHSLRRHAFSKQFCETNGYDYLSTSAARNQFANDLVKRMNQKYLQHWKGNDFLGFFERNALKLILSKHLMLAKQKESVRDRLYDCFKVLEAAVGLRKTDSSRAWLIRQSVELDSLEMLWECLLGTEELNDDANKRHSWTLAERASESAQRDNLATCYPAQWARIEKLYNRALDI